MSQLVDVEAGGDSLNCGARLTDSREGPDAATHYISIRPIDSSEIRASNKNTRNITHMAELTGHINQHHACGRCRFQSSESSKMNFICDLRLEYL